MSVTENLENLAKTVPTDKVTIVAVSKTHPEDKIRRLYEAGQRDFGENKVQEMTAKQEALPTDIRWHMIGHLQTNKVKYIAPFVHLIHSVDSLKLLREIDKQAGKNGRIIDCLLQVYIAKEETKYGLDENEAEQLLGSAEYKSLKNIRICGLMGMATNTDNEMVVRNEFRSLKKFFEKIRAEYFQGKNHFKWLSMGMTQDYRLAIEEGSNMIRVGSLIFGERTYSTANNL